MDESVGFGGVERDHVRPLLKTLGFRKRALVFTRGRGELTDVVSLQRSSGNFGGHVRFYVNCGVHSAEFATAIGDPTVERPREVDCQFRCRLDELAPEAPQWFEIDDETDASAVGPVLVGYLDTAVRALGAVTTADELAHRISDGVAIEAFRYRVATGDWASAREIHRSVRAEFGAEPRWARIDAIMRSHLPASKASLIDDGVGSA
ncbi:DUF4304 domain-containing protein [Rhodococcus gannanensis]|uniref:DUF4304 domain-containing protein n=1 Tax=Rhodococcus gannanensis TaxID=1960308 RepID=A0ABW4P2T4_9NOCA